MIDGYLPPKVLGLVVEWADMHQTELQTNWETILSCRGFNKIPPNGLIGAGSPKWITSANTNSNWLFQTD